MPINNEDYFSKANIFLSAFYHLETEILYSWCFKNRVETTTMEENRDGNLARFHSFPQI